jgi:hypothetical protein
VLQEAGALEEDLPDRISLTELEGLARRGERVHLLDVRTEASYLSSPSRAAGAVRAPAERTLEVVRRMGLPPGAWIVSYCT